MQDLLTVKEVAKLLRLSPQTLYKMLENGEIPALRIGKQWRFESQAVRDWLANRGEGAPTALPVGAGAAMGTSPE
ncbi:MAG: helix-turn-helix domain-containing protein [Acidobacteriota bacterium]